MHLVHYLLNKLNNFVAGCKTFFSKKSRTEYPIALNGVNLSLCGMIRVNAANSRYDKRPLVIRRCFRFEKSKSSTTNYRSVNINRYF
jgi:hypothetical protein